MCFFTNRFRYFRNSSIYFRNSTLYVRNSPDMATDKEANRCLNLYIFILVDIFYRACISCTLRGYSQRSLRATCHSWAGLSPVRVYEAFAKVVDANQPCKEGNLIQHGASCTSQCNVPPSSHWLLFETDFAPSL
jgi:hypothetical protein